MYRCDDLILMMERVGLAGFSITIQAVVCEVYHRADDDRGRQLSAIICALDIKEE
jgi:hypothetical protein